jgi:hypothetical protein
MNPRPGAARLLVLAVLGLAVLAPSAVAAPKVVVFNLTTEGLVQPARVFFQADSGPYLDGLQWTGWGTPTAVGTGSYVLDCTNGGSACGSSTAKTIDAARWTLTDLGPCPRFGPDALVYRTGTVTIDRADGSTSEAFDPGDTFCGIRPTAAEARAAVRRFALRRLHAHAITVRCHVVSGVELDCTARWTSPSGAARKRGFNVFGRLHGGLRVTAYGV